MTRPQGFGAYQNFYAEIWQDEQERWWAFLYLAPAGAMRTHHPAGSALPVHGGPWTDRADAIEAAKIACDTERVARALSAAPRCTATRPRHRGRDAETGCTFRFRHGEPEDTR